MQVNDFQQIIPCNTQKEFEQMIERVAHIEAHRLAWKTCGHSINYQYHMILPTVLEQCYMMDIDELMAIVECGDSDDDVALLAHLLELAPY